MKEILRHAHFHLLTAEKNIKDKKLDEASAQIKLADAIIWKILIKEAKNGKTEIR